MSKLSRIGRKGWRWGTMRLVEGLPRNRSADVIGRQLLRSATSVGANYRAACRGRSVADVVAKLATVEEGADESMYWMKLLVEAGLVPAVHVKDLAGEADEIIAMTVASMKTLRRRNEHSRPKLGAPG